MTASWRGPLGGWHALPAETSSSNWRLVWGRCCTAADAQANHARGRHVQWEHRTSIL